ncbi:hypothetical protein C7B77_21330 [Chamaesiphon polymorphus CCALA 037]|uniref:Uncharacterized protein n=1 Tax=Chamaesiphon polymorphus CCALA 037 TaxID=2107692 RepID=A0A2T1G373_9CYAN|nr:hypothetical protein C7B77_21330 [Chamaesiphon polymorphus CCALA 037]
MDRGSWIVDRGSWIVNFGTQEFCPFTHSPIHISPSPNPKAIETKSDKDVCPSSFRRQSWLLLRQC